MSVTRSPSALVPNPKRSAVTPGLTGVTDHSTVSQYCVPGTISRDGYSSSAAFLLNIEFSLAKLVKSMGVLKKKDKGKDVEICLFTMSWLT